MIQIHTNPTTWPLGGMLVTFWNVAGRFDPRGCRGCGKSPGKANAELILFPSLGDGMTKFVASVSRCEKDRKRQSNDLCHFVIFVQSYELGDHHFLLSSWQVPHSLRPWKSFATFAEIPNSQYVSGSHHFIHFIMELFPSSARSELFYSVLLLPYNIAKGILENWDTQKYGFQWVSIFRWTKKLDDLGVPLFEETPIH